MCLDPKVASMSTDDVCARACGWCVALSVCLCFASPELTWRDVQYITLMTSRPEPMVDGQWVTNALGRKGWCWDRVFLWSLMQPVAQLLSASLCWSGAGGLGYNHCVLVDFYLCMRGEPCWTCTAKCSLEVPAPRKRLFLHCQSPFLHVCVVRECVCVCVWKGITKVITAVNCMLTHATFKLYFNFIGHKTPTYLLQLVRVMKLV